MNTRLTFEAPADFSVGRVAVQNEHGPVQGMDRDTRQQDAGT